MSAPFGSFPQRPENPQNPQIAPPPGPVPSGPPNLVDIENLSPEPPEVDEEEEERERDAARLGMSDDEIVRMVISFYDEARDAKEGKPEAAQLSRVDEWQKNVDAYNAVYDISQKAAWQAQERISSPFTFVERFAAFIQQAVVQPGGWYSVKDPTDPDNRMENFAKKIVRVMLDQSGTNRFGQPVSFNYTITELMKTGALKYISMKVIIEGTRVKVQCVNPDELFLDPTGRGQYRIHSYDVDRSKLMQMKGMEHEDGESVFDGAAIGRMKDAAGHTRKQREQQMKDTQAKHPSEHDELRRRPANLIDYYGYLYTMEGEVSEEKVYIVIGNELELLRGPETNPFWHGQDWYIGGPVIDVPNSVWGRTYLEPIRPVWESFTDTTNALLDGFNASVLNAYGIHLDALEDPSTAADGVHPGKTFILDENWPPGQDFLQVVQLGNLPPEAFDVWNALDKKMQEMGFLSDLQLGKGAKADTTATEVDASAQSTSVFNSSVAGTIEAQILSVMLSQVFSCSLQALDPEADPELAAELGEDLTAMIVQNRAEFRDRKFQWVASGISSLVERGRRVRSTMGLLNILGGSEELKASFQQEFSISRLLRRLMTDMGVEPEDLEITEQEKVQQRMRELKAQLEAAQAQTGPPGGGPTAPGSVGGPPGADSAGGAALAGGVDTDGPVSVDPLSSFSGGNAVG